MIAYIMITEKNVTKHNKKTNNYYEQMTCMQHCPKLDCTITE